VDAPFLTPDSFYAAEVTCAVWGDESKALVPPQGYRGEMTIAMRSTKVRTATRVLFCCARHCRRCAAPVPNLGFCWQVMRNQSCRQAHIFTPEFISLLNSLHNCSSTQVNLDLISSPINTPRKTKIVCTLGPSCWSEENLGALMDAGMNVARFNFSHGEHAGHKEVCVLASSVIWESQHPNLPSVLSELDGFWIRLKQRLTTQPCQPRQL
jgi:hypothetical protein